FGIAFDRVAETAPAAAPQTDHFAEFSAVRRALADVVRLSAAPRADIAAGRAGLPAGRAPGAEALAVLAAHHDDRARMLDLEFIGDAEAAAELARPLAVRRQAETADDDRHLGFEHLDRHVAQKGDAHIGA